MRVVFLGTSDFAVPALRRLAASHHEIVLVVTQPDRPAGRGRKLAPPPVKVAAAELGFEPFQPERVNTIAARARVGAAEPDVLVVAAFGQILRPRLLAIPPRGSLNIHASLLPRHRGASPIHHAILAGDDTVGVSIMLMDEGLDTGPVGITSALPACPTETAGELHDRLAEQGADLIVEALDRHARDDLVFRPQDEALATHAPLLGKDDGVLDFARPAVELDRRIRGLSPWPGCYADLVTAEGTRRLILERARPVSWSGSAAPGTLVAVAADALLIACGEGALEVPSVKPRGKRAMSVRDFLNGHRVALGDRFVPATAT